MSRLFNACDKRNWMAVNSEGLERWAKWVWPLGQSARIDSEAGAVPQLRASSLHQKQNPIHRTSQNNDVFFVFLNDSYECRSESPFGFFFFMCVCSRMSHLSISQRSRPFGPSLISQSVKSPEGKQLPRSPFSLFFPLPYQTDSPY